MKNRIALGLCFFLLTACSGSPDVDALMRNKALMAEIQFAAQKDNPSTGVIPIALDLGSLSKNGLISNASADKIRSLTNCSNLSGIELIFTRGQVTHTDVHPSICTSEG